LATETQRIETEGILSFLSVPLCVSVANPVFVGAKKHASVSSGRVGLPQQSQLAPTTDLA